MRELDTDLLKIIGYFGVDNQQTKLLEEVTELEDVINDTKQSTLESREDDIRHVTEEIADVMVILRQFQLYYGISDNDVILTMRSKTDRTLNRIKEGYYTKENQ